MNSRQLSGKNKTLFYTVKLTYGRLSAHVKAYFYSEAGFFNCKIKYLH